MIYFSVMDSCASCLSIRERSYGFYVPPAYLYESALVLRLSILVFIYFLSFSDTVYYELNPMRHNAFWWHFTSLCMYMHLVGAHAALRGSAAPEYGLAARKGPVSTAGAAPAAADSVLERRIGPCAHRSADFADRDTER